MDFKEKLRQASMAAEKNALEKMPSDEEISWTPSDSFNERMAKTISEIDPIMPKRAKPIWRIYAATAAAVAVIGLALSPLIHKSSDFIDPKEESGSGLSEDDSQRESEGLSHPESDSTQGQEGESAAVSEDHTTDHTTDDSWDEGHCTEGVQEIPSDTSVEDLSSASPDGVIVWGDTFCYRPEYIIDGYSETDFVANKDSISIEYSNGRDTIELQYFSGAAPLESYLFNEAVENNGNKYYINVDNPYNNWGSINIAWIKDNITFVIIGNQSVTQTELLDMACSVKRAE